MAIHHGKILEEAIRSRGFALTSVAKQLQISRKTLYNYFEQDDLPLQKIALFDRILGLGLSSKYPELSNYYTLPSEGVVADQGQAEYWKKKYIELLEKYTQLLEGQ